MKSFPQDLYEAALNVLERSYSPYSHFKVACALRADNGDIVSGCNVENASYSLVSCAEAVAIGSLVSAGQLRLREALVLVDEEILCPPCGACRQRLYEMADEQAVVHLCTTKGHYKPLTVGELLPFAFGSQNLKLD